MKKLSLFLVPFFIFSTVLYVDSSLANGYSYQRRERALEERMNHFIEKQVQSKEFQKKQKNFKRRIIDIHRAKHYTPPQPQQQKQSQAQTKPKKDGTKDQKTNLTTSTETKKKKP